MRKVSDVGDMSMKCPPLLCTAAVFFCFVLIAMIEHFGPTGGLVRTGWLAAAVAAIYGVFVWATGRK